MAKKDYFSHDYHSRDHLRDVRKDFGLEGYGLYWCIVEILHEQGGSIKETDIAPIAYDLRADEDMLKAILYNYGMFQIKKGCVYSERVIDNLKRREEISEKRKAAAELRWQGDDKKDKPEIELDEEDISDEPEQAKQFYIENIDFQFNRFLEECEEQESKGHTIYDYRPLFKAVVEELRDKDYVAINRKSIPVYRVLQVIGRHIKVRGSIQNLDAAVRDVENRYKQGKIRNKTNYMIAALYNAALMDTK